MESKKFFQSLNPAPKLRLSELESPLLWLPTVGTELRDYIEQHSKLFWEPRITRSLDPWMFAGDWGLPPIASSVPLFHALFAPFSGIGAFSNLLIWEHLGGLMTLGTDASGNRYFVATNHPDAPVFWMDHEAERPGLHFLVANSLALFLKQETGMEPVKKGDRPNRKSQYNSYEKLCESISENRWTWPPFLLGRSEWLLDLIAFGAPVEIPSGFFAADFAAEAIHLAGNEPLILHWLIRSFVTEQQEQFQEVRKYCREDVSPLIKSAVEVLESEWNEEDGTSRFTRARAELRS